MDGRVAGARSGAGRVRAYMVLRKTEELSGLYGSDDAAAEGSGLLRYLQDAAQQTQARLAIRSLPSRLQAAAGLETKGAATEHDALVCSVSIDAEAIETCHRLADDDSYEPLMGFGIDAPLYGGESWCPGAGGGGAFWNRAAAEQLMGAGALGALTGKGVNLALVDSGLDPIEWSELGLTRGRSYESTQHALYKAEAAPEDARHGHAFVMARQIASLAKDATVHDYAVLPPRLSRAAIPAVAVEAPAFVSDMTAAYVDLVARLAWSRLQGDASPWVILNAWSIFERAWRPAQDLDRPQAWLNRLIAQAVRLGADVVFAAGNCGGLCPDIRCGEDDRGPGRSIVGSAGHPDVLTVGAVRSDSIWLGYSSQGPGVMGAAQPAREKPDIVAPSQFRDGEDASFLNTGTSTACALAAAAIAALREGYPDAPPATLKQAIIATARKTDGAGWSPRSGHGIMDVSAAAAALATS
jgi:Subtilase family